MTKTKNDIAWEKLFYKYDILEHIESDGVFRITAPQIREFREPRLMCKFDFRNHLPKLFKRNKLSILPITRGTYIISKFDAYEDFEDISDEIIHVPFPQHISSIDYDNITSEAMALNCAFVTSIISDFMEEEGVQPTVSGRMSSLSFDFNINSIDKSSVIPIEVTNSQIEIDGGFEGYESLALVEAKNVISSDFIIRQLYYPYRLWESKMQKKVRPMFLTYSNGVFKLHEYKFIDPNNYNSITLVRQKNYMIGEDKISLDDIIHVLRTINIVEEPRIPFPQADSFEKVINLCEELVIRELSQEDIYTMFDFQPRQADYYANAGIYLGLLERYSEIECTMFRLTNVGKDIMNRGYKERQLDFSRLILEHKVFHEAFESTITNNRPLANHEIVEIMKENYVYNVKSAQTYKRRARTVVSWITWILNLKDD